MRLRGPSPIDRPLFDFAFIPVASHWQFRKKRAPLAPLAAKMRGSQNPQKEVPSKKSQRDVGWGEKARRPERKALDVASGYINLAD